MKAGGRKFVALLGTTLLNYMFAVFCIYKSIPLVDASVFIVSTTLPLVGYFMANVHQAVKVSNNNGGNVSVGG